MTPDRHPRRGAALVVVLVFAALISSLAITAMRTAVSGASAAVVFTDQMRAEQLGRDAANLVAYRLRSQDPDVLRGGSFVAHLPSADVTVDYLAETSRIDVNAAPTNLLTALFIAGGVEPELAAEFAERAQRKRGTKATSAAPATPAFVRTEQVVDAWGIPPSLYRRIRPALTATSRLAKVDPSLAGPLVVTALMDGDEARAAEFLERRTLGFLSADEALAQLPATMRRYASFALPRAVRATARVDIAHRFRRAYEFVVTTPEGPTAETRVLSWQPLER